MKKTTQKPKPIGINFARAHKRLWLWLAEDSRRHKIQWPEWTHNGGKIPLVTHRCFACEVGYLEICPLLDAQCQQCFAAYTQWRYDHSPALALRIANMPWTGPQVFIINVDKKETS